MNKYDVDKATEHDIFQHTWGDRSTFSYSFIRSASDQIDRNAIFWATRVAVGIVVDRCVLTSIQNALRDIVK
jgi:hypothetical protein